MDRKIRRQALKYVLLDHDLYRRTIDGLHLKCLDTDQSKIAMGEVHEGICGTHQSAHKMKWLLRRAGFYWPTMLNDCFRYYKGCESCQKFRDVQLIPAAMLHPIIKPWPFRGWALDFVGQIYPASSKGHRFVLVATDYFTKWTEAIPLKNMTHKEVIVIARIWLNRDGPRSGPRSRKGFEDIRELGLARVKFGCVSIFSSLNPV